jgi:hypothetical protein
VPTPAGIPHADLTAILRRNTQDRISHPPACAILQPHRPGADAAPRLRGSQPVSAAAT